MKTDDIQQMTLEQTRLAAEELLNSTTGDLAGADAERFDALHRHATELREREQQRVTASRDLVRGLASGELFAEGEGRSIPGYGRHGVTEDRTPDGQQRDTAMRTIERAVTEGTLAAGSAETIERAIGNGTPQSRSWAARWAATTADPHYLSAFGKLLCDPQRGHMLFTPEESAVFRTASELQMEQRAMSLTDSAGGYLIPAQLDPSILLSSNGSTNPLRQIARVVQTTGDTWNGISSDGVTAHWLPEANEVSDDSPSLAQPSIPLFKGSAWVPFSYEVEQDAVNFVAEISRLLMDSVEQLSNAAFTLGSGSGQPTGFVTALAASSPTVIVTGDGSEALAAGDAYKLQNALPPRFQPNSRFVAALPTINALRQFETTSGALKYPSLQDTPPTLLGRSVHEVSHMDSTINAAATEANYLLAVGDWSHFVIADKIGTVVELVPHVFGSSRRPTGQRGFFAHFRTGSDVIVDNAFRILNVATTA